MFKESYNVIGMMSGTSLDGIDLAYINFSFHKKWQFSIIYSETIPYKKDWLERLSNSTSLAADEIEKLDFQYTELISKFILEFIKKNNILNIDAICSHGHTVFHQPESGYTLQIGNLPLLAKKTNIKTVCNFRVQDVKLGGQGAPLVPIGDRLLFSQYDYCLNLGGFSNISFEKNNKRIAYDICPVNTILNFYSEKLGFNYDNKGIFASKGQIDSILLESLNADTYYKTTYPKSLGIEYVHSVVIPLINKYNISIENILATYIEHIAIQIQKSIQIIPSSLYITGGGAYNDFLIQRIKHHLPKSTIVIPEKTIIEYKEALIFGLLGVLKLRNEINVLSSVTGAKHDHSSGYIFSV